MISIQALKLLHYCFLSKTIIVSFKDTD